MDQITQLSASDEPIGIIISTGLAPEPAPRFSAYVWGPVPDDAPDAEASGTNRAA
ncbi:MAG: hypothetical protein ACKOCV_05960 [Gemmatimonadota bacterium]